MCVAIQGIVLAINGTKATVDINGNRLDVHAGLVQVKPDDHVLVHAGCIMQVISEEESSMLADLFKELEDAEKNE